MIGAAREKHTHAVCPIVPEWNGTCATQITSQLTHISLKFSKGCINRSTVIIKKQNKKLENNNY